MLVFLKLNKIFVKYNKNLNCYIIISNKLKIILFNFDFNKFNYLYKFNNINLKNNIYLSKNNFKYSLLYII